MPIHKFITGDFISTKLFIVIYILILFSLFFVIKNNNIYLIILFSYIVLFIIIYHIFYIIGKVKFKTTHYSGNQNKILKYTKNIFNKIRNEKIDENTIPKKLIQTVKNKKEIPQKVFDNIKKYSNDYEHLLFDDYEVINFLRKNYGKLFVNKFKSMKKGAHKADLFRYCYLYKYGGVYADIKTEFTKQLNDVITDNGLYVVLAHHVFVMDNTIYNGFIATPPHNDIFINLINQILFLDDDYINSNINYLVLCEQFYHQISEKLNVKDLERGTYLNIPYNITIFQENNDCTKYKELKPDKWGYCEKVLDKDDNVMFNTRYSDYPWIKN